MESDKYSINFRSLKWDLQLLHLPNMSTFTLKDLEDAKNKVLQTNPTLETAILHAYDELKEFYLHTRGAKIGERIENKNQLRIIDMAQSILNLTTISFEEHKEIDDCVNSIKKVLEDVVAVVNANPNKVFSEDELVAIKNNYINAVRSFIHVYFQALNEKNNYRYKKLIDNVENSLDDEVILDNPLDDLVYVLNQKIVDEGKKLNASRSR